MKNEFIRYGFFMLIALLIFIFIYPTIYRYDKYDQKIPVRINRITGKTEMLYSDGWTVPAPAQQLDLSAYQTVTPSNQTEIIKNIDLKLSISKKVKPSASDNKNWNVVSLQQQRISATIYNGNDRSLKSILIDINVYKEDGTVDFERKYKLTNVSGNIEPFANSSNTINTDFDLNENQKFDYKIISVDEEKPSANFSNYGVK